MNENAKTITISENFFIRPLTHEDYDDVYDICKDIWEGTDYLPNYFHQWVDDTGFFYGMVDKTTNHVIGVDKFSILYDGTGWFEGLRVHPAYQGKGLATVMTDHILAVAIRELDSGRVTRLAFSTHSTAKQSISLMTERKFILKQKYALAMRNYEKVEPDVSNISVTPWCPTFEEVKNSEYLQKRDGILPLAFYFQEFTSAYFDHLKEKDAFITINGHNGIQYFKGSECYFIVMDESAEGFLAFSDWCWDTYKKQSKGFPLTSFPLPNNTLIKAIEAFSFENWMNWEEDYLYFVYIS